MPRTTGFIEELKKALTDRPMVSRKMSSIVRQCGRSRVTTGFLAKLEQALQRANIHTDRQIRSTSTLAKHSIKFSLQAFAPSEVEFGREKQLVELIVHSVGRVPPLLDLKIRRREFALPSGRSVDLLCERVSRDGRGELVAIEFKKGVTGAVAVEQLANYLKELKATRIAEGRKVRGIILARQITSSLEFQPADGSRIDMYEYRFAFNKVGTVPSRPMLPGATQARGDDAQSTSMTIGQ